MFIRRSSRHGCAGAVQGFAVAGVIIPDFNRDLRIAEPVGVKRRKQGWALAGVQPSRKKFGQDRKERKAAAIAAVELHEPGQSCYGSDGGLAIGRDIVETGPLT